MPHRCTAMSRAALLVLAMICTRAEAEVRLERWAVTLADVPVSSDAMETVGAEAAMADSVTPLVSGQILTVSLVIDNGGDPLAPSELVITEPLVDDLQYVPDSAMVVGGPSEMRFLVSQDGSHFIDPTSGQPPWRMLRWVSADAVAPGERLMLRYRVRVP